MLHCHSCGCHAKALAHRPVVDGGLGHIEFAFIGDFFSLLETRLCTIADPSVLDVFEQATSTLQELDSSKRLDPDNVCRCPLMYRF